MDKQELLNKIASTRRYTLHSHTEFCDGRATMEAFAREAVARGFDLYGFTPHSPVPIVSPCNMLERNVEVYSREFERIRDTYGDRVTFLRSMEIDYLGREWGATNSFFDNIPLDYRLSSVHFIPSQDGELVDIDGRFETFVKKMHQNFRDDIRYVVEKFYEQSCMMVEEGGFDMIGHLDKIGHNADHYSPGIESEGWYQSLLDDLIGKVASAGLIVEINTKAWKEHGRMFPHVDKWRKIVELEVPLVVNSDAHVPALIDAGRDDAYRMLDALAGQKKAESIS